MKKVFLTLSFGLLLLNGCSNFMDGSSLKNDIEKTIDYNKLPFSIVTISADSDKITSIIPGTGLFDSKYKPGDSFELECEVKNSCEFIKWSAIPEGGATFREPASKKTLVTVNAKQVQIVPLCVARPAVEASRILPEYFSDGVRQDSLIVIPFSANATVSEDSFYFTQDEIENILTEEVYSADVHGENKIYGYKNKNGSVIFKNIKLTASEKNILSHFECPNFSNNTLSIPVKRNDLLLSPESDQLLKVTVSISKDIFTGDEYKTQMAEDYSYSYIINAGSDNVKPLLNSLELFGIDNVQLSGKALDDFEESDFYSNHVKSIKLKAEGYDEGSGVSSLKLFITPKYEKNGVAQNCEPFAVTVGTSFFTNPVDFVSSAEFSFDLQTVLGEKWKDSYEGIVQLDFYAVDYSGNVSDSSITRYVVYDNSFYNSKAYLTNAKLPKVIDETVDFSKLSYNEIWTKEEGEIEFYWGNLDDVFLYYDGKAYSTPTGENSYELKWGTDEKNLDHTSQISAENNSAKVTHNINRNTYLKLVAADKCGNVYEIPVCIPSIAKFLTVTCVDLDVGDDGELKNSRDAAFNIVFEDNGNVMYERQLACKLKSDPEKQLYELSSPIVTSIVINKIPAFFADRRYLLKSFHDLEYYYQFYDSYGNLRCRVYSPLVKVDYSSEDDGFEAPDINPENIKFYKGEINSSNFYGEIELRNYDPSVKYYYYDTLPEDKNIGTYIPCEVKENDGKYYLRYCKNLMESNENYNFYALKNGKSKAIKNVNVTPKNKDGLDTIPPYTGEFDEAYSASGFLFKEFGDNILGLYLTEKGSRELVEIEYAYIPYSENFKFTDEMKNSLKLYKTFASYDGDTYIDFAIPMKDLESERLYHIALRLYDKAGNSLFSTTGDAFISELSDKKLSAVYDSSTKKIKVSLPSDALKPKIGKSTYYPDAFNIYWEPLSCNAVVFKPDTNTILDWNPICDGAEMEQKGDKFEIEIENSDDTGKFVKITASESMNVVKGNPEDENTWDYYGTGFLRTAPVFVYTGAPECGVKDIIEGKTGITILCDADCLYTVYSSSKGYGDDVSMWEANASVVEIGVTNKNKTVSTSNVQSGEHYVLIAHFADGTAVMSDVKQK